MNSLAVSLLLLFSSGTSAPPDLTITIERLTPRVVVANYVSNNVIAIATEGGVMVVDSHRSPTIMRAILAGVGKELGRGDWAWLVNTHGDWDHTWGNEAVEGATRIGHVRCAETVEGYDARRRLAAWRHESEVARLRAEVADTTDGAGDGSRKMERLRAEEVIVADLHEGFVPTPPEERFEERMRIDGGDVTAELIFVGAAHTDNDVFVFVPEEGLLLTGDVFCSGHSLCFGVNALTDGVRLLGVIDEILARARDGLVMVPGHGQVMNRDDLVRLRGIVQTKWDRVWKSARKSGRAAG